MGGGADNQDGNEHSIATNNGITTNRPKEILQGKDGEERNRKGKELKAVIAGPSRPRIVELWNDKRARLDVGEVRKYEAKGKRRKPRKEKDQLLLGRPAPGLKRNQYQAKGVEGHDEKITLRHERTRARKKESYRRGE